MRNTRLLPAALSLILLLTLQTVRCPEDDSGSYFTGKTRTSESGRQMKQYKCYSYGHLFWVYDRR